MSATKKVRNDSGSDIKVEYAGNDYWFKPGVTENVEAGLADNAQQRFAPALQIDYRKELPAPEPPKPKASKKVRLKK